MSVSRGHCQRIATSLAWAMKPRLASWAMRRSARYPRISRATRAVTLVFCGWCSLELFLATDLKCCLSIDSSLQITFRYSFVVLTANEPLPNYTACTVIDGVPLAHHLLPSVCDGKTAMRVWLFFFVFIFYSLCDRRSELVVLLLLAPMSRSPKKHASPACCRRGFLLHICVWMLAPSPIHAVCAMLTLRIVWHLRPVSNLEFKWVRFSWTFFLKKKN